WPRHRQYGADRRSGADALALRRQVAHGRGKALSRRRAGLARRLAEAALQRCPWAKRAPAPLPCTASQQDGARVHGQVSGRNPCDRRCRQRRGPRRDRRSHCRPAGRAALAHRACADRRPRRFSALPAIGRRRLDAAHPPAVGSADGRRTAWPRAIEGRLCVAEYGECRRPPRLRLRRAGRERQPLRRYGRGHLAHRSGRSALWRLAPRGGGEPRDRARRLHAQRRLRGLCRRPDRYADARDARRLSDSRKRSFACKPRRDPLHDAARNLGRRLSLLQEKGRLMDRRRLLAALAATPAALALGAAKKEPKRKDPPEPRRSRRRKGAKPLEKQVDVAVVGAGAIGAWTAWHLVRRGFSVRLFDAYGAGNGRAASNMPSMMLDPVQGGDLLYAGLADESAKAWGRLSETASLPILTPCEAVTTLSASDPIFEVRGVDRLTGDELRPRYTQIAWRPDAAALVAEKGGAMLAGRRGLLETIL